MLDSHASQGKFYNLEGLVVISSVFGLFLGYCSIYYVTCLVKKSYKLYSLVLAKLIFTIWLNDLIFQERNYRLKILTQMNNKKMIEQTPSLFYELSFFFNCIMRWLHHPYFASLKYLLLFLVQEKQFSAVSRYNKLLIDTINCLQIPC